LFHLLRTRPDFSLPGGILLNFGVYDLSLMPSSITFPDAPILNLKGLKAYTEAFTPFVSWEARKLPQYSPLYEDLEQFRGRLSPALFTSGTIDPLLDNTMLISMKWAIAGGDMVAKYYPGACHGFLAHPIDEAKVCMRDITRWLEEKRSLA
jgi:acetyl esterase/lipase